MVCSNENQQKCFHVKILRELNEHYDKLIEEILGEGYYNYGMDVYSCNEFALEDMLREIKALKSRRRNLLIFLSGNIFLFLTAMLAISLR